MCVNFQPYYTHSYSHNCSPAFHLELQALHMVPWALDRSLLVGQVEEGSPLRVDPRTLVVLGEIFLLHILGLHRVERHQGLLGRTCQAQMDLVGKAHLDMDPVEPQVGKGTVQEQGMARVLHLVGTDLALRETVLELQGWRGTVQVRPDLEGIRRGQRGLQETGPGLLGRVERNQGQMAQSGGSRKGLLVGQGLLRMGNWGHQGPNQAIQD